MDALVLKPIPNAPFVHVKIADGSEGMAHSDGVLCASLDAALHTIKVVLGRESIESLPDSPSTEQIARLRAAYDARNTQGGD